MAKIFLLFVVNLANSWILAAIHAAIRKVLSHFSFTTELCRGLIFLFIISMNACSHKTKNIAQIHPILPSTCLDKTGKYTAIHYIKTKTSYNQPVKPYSPIKAKKGIIQSDFNKDKRLDYIFLEQSILTNKKAKTRLVLCISTPKSYQRKLPPFPIHINTVPDFQNIHEQIEWKNNQLTLSSFKHEHNWGSDNEYYSYYYSIKNKDFTLNKHEIVSSSGDGMRSDTHDIFNLKTLHYQRSSQCGSLEEGCHSHQQQGRIVLPKVRSTLLNPRKIYTRLEPST